MSNFMLSGAEHGGEIVNFAQDIVGTTIDLDASIINKVTRYELREHNDQDGNPSFMGIFIGYFDKV